ncbi:hypothetical protein X743_33935 [Mesorhizobium sp. LNHC252B00]|nr:hypothetical protein X743_33935 [Mesorhizobium sp. LNHC252B00]
MVGAFALNQICPDIGVDGTDGAPRKHAPYREAAKCGDFLPTGVDGQSIIMIPRRM